MLLPPAQLYDPRTKTILHLDRPAARNALASHDLALLDPPATLEMVAICWWAMRFDHDAPRDRPRLVGPDICFPAEAFSSPTLPIGGLSTAEALRLYIDAGPVHQRDGGGPLISDRIPLRAYRDPPGLWRRSVALPAACIMGLTGPQLAGAGMAGALVPSAAGRLVAPIRGAPVPARCCRGPDRRLWLQRERRC